MYLSLLLSEAQIRIQADIPVRLGRIKADETIIRPSGSRTSYFCRTCWQVMSHHVISPAACCHSCTSCIWDRIHNAGALGSQWENLKMSAVHKPAHMCNVKQYLSSHFTCVAVAARQRWTGELILFWQLKGHALVTARPERQRITPSLV